MKSSEEVENLLNNLSTPLMEKLKSDDYFKGFVAALELVLEKEVHSVQTWNDRFLEDLGPLLGIYFVGKKENEK